MPSGRIAERGTHESLDHSRGLYSGLYEKQLLEEELPLATWTPGSGNRAGNVLHARSVENSVDREKSAWRFPCYRIHDSEQNTPGSRQQRSNYARDRKREKDWRALMANGPKINSQCRFLPSFGVVDTALHRR